jgi:predicted ester cyclase
MKRLLNAGVLLAAASLAGGIASGKATEEPAREPISVFYEALSAGTDVLALLGRATSTEWASCGGNDVCRSREQVVRTVTGLHTAVPDLKWEIKEVLVSDNRIIVRGEASGTPAGDFMGVPQGGKSFNLMSIDIHTVESGKIIRSYHVEDWVGAIRQLSAK